MKIKLIDFLKRLNWVNTVFLIFSPIVVWICVPDDLLRNGWNWPLMFVFVLYCIVTSLSITGGYHRLFAHRSYDANPLIRFLYLIFGAAALQGSALKWSTDHRRHHRFVDTDQDPYSIKKGFWYAHMGWVFFKEEEAYKDKFVPDLANDRLVAWQHRHYFALVLMMGFIVPTLVGWALGHAWGGLLYIGLARVVLTHHSTFLINSACHYFGKQPYGDKTTARDSAVLALLTYGEGYHCFHHRFQIDYRNGILWYQWDPTKWLIWVGSKLGFTWNLKRVPDSEILKARLTAEEQKLLQTGVSSQRVRELKTRIEHAQSQYRELYIRYRLLKKEWRRAHDDRMLTARESLKRIKIEMDMAQLEFRAGLKQWRLYLKNA